MKIVSQKDAIESIKPNDITCYYYLFDEYEVITNVQEPHTTQVWHHHDRIWETTIMTEGEMILEWIEGGEKKTRIVYAGDVIESQTTPHNYSNNSNSPAKFITIKQVLSGKNHRDTFKSDKILD